MVDPSEISNFRGLGQDRDVSRTESVLVCDVEAHVEGLAAQLGEETHVRQEWSPAMCARAPKSAGP
jgi:hypothetical protein